MNLYLCSCECSCPWKLEALEIPGARVTGGCEHTPSPSVDTVNITWSSVRGVCILKPFIYLFTVHVYNVCGGDTYV